MKLDDLTRRRKSHREERGLFALVLVILVAAALGLFLAAVALSWLVHTIAGWFG